MKVVVIGGTGLIGSKLVNKLKGLGHNALAASPSTGVNVITGEGLDKILNGADVVVDVANSPSFEDKAVLEFFETSSRNLFKAEKKAGVDHHIALSIVGTDRVPESGYLRAKLAQEKLIESSHIPYTIVRSTQFFEFLGGIADSNTDGKTAHLSTAFLQPIAADDVVNALLKVVLEEPTNGIIDIAGPERFRLSDIVEQYLIASKDPRKVIADPEAKYFGAKLIGDMLVPIGDARLGAIYFKNWFSSQKKH